MMYTRYKIDAQDSEGARLWKSLSNTVDCKVLLEKHNYFFFNNNNKNQSTHAVLYEQPLIIIFLQILMYHLSKKIFLRGMSLTFFIVVGLVNFSFLIIQGNLVFFYLRGPGKYLGEHFLEIISESGYKKKFLK
jgi:hypothetical protein